MRPVRSTEFRRARESVDEERTRPLRRGRRWQAALAVPLLAIATAVPAAAAAAVPPASAFTDVASVPWAEASVFLLAAQGVVKGVSPTAFAPYAPVTGEQAIVLLSRILPGTTSAPPEQTPGGVDPWALAAVEWAEGRNIIRHPNTFVATAPAPRDRVVAWVVRALGLGPSTTPTFADAALIPLQYAGEIGAAQAQGLVQGDQNGNFNPSAQMTRAQMAVLLVRAEKALARGQSGSPALFDWSMVQGSASQPLTTGTATAGGDALPIGTVDTGAVQTHDGTVHLRYIAWKNVGAGTLTVTSNGTTVSRWFAWGTPPGLQSGVLWFFPSGGAVEGYGFTPSPQQVFFQGGGGGLPSSGSVTAAAQTTGSVTATVCASSEGCPQGSSHDEYSGPAVPRLILWVLAIAGGPQFATAS